MANDIVVIKSISEIGKYAKFELENGDCHHGKYGYFDAAMGACFNQLGSMPDMPIKARLDKLGIDYFHVEAIWFNDMWVKIKARGY